MATFNQHTHPSSTQPPAHFNLSNMSDAASNASIRSTSYDTSTLDNASIFSSRIRDDVSTTPTSRHPSGEHPPPHAPQAAPQPSNPAVRANLRARLRELTVEATRQFNMQPRHTVVEVSKQVQRMYDGYAKTGSESRLSWNIWEFLSRRDDMRDTEWGPSGKGGELVFWSHDEAVKKMNEIEGVATVHAWDDGNNDNPGLKRRRDDDDDDDLLMGDPMQTPTRKTARSHPNRNFRINAEMPGLGLDSNDIPHQPNATTYLNPTQIHASLSTPLDYPRLPTPSYTHDSASTSLLRTLPFRPADITFTFPSYTNFPASPLTYLTHMNKLITLHNILANAILSHHDAKYLSHDLNTGEDVRRLAHGYIILRAGVAELIRERVRGLFGDAQGNEWGMSSETQAFLREVYESKELGTAVTSGVSEISGLPATTGFAGDGVVHARIPVKSADDGGLQGVEMSPVPGEVVGNRGVLSSVEEAMLARASSVPVQGLRAWWEQKRGERRCAVAMRAWVAAREVERIARARREGRFFGWEDWGSKEWEGVDFGWGDVGDEGSGN